MPCLRGDLEQGDWVGDQRDGLYTSMQSQPELFYWGNGV